MQLRALSIRNFRSLETVHLDNLGTMNVLVGRNNVGKSSLFSALHLLRSSISGQGGPDPATIFTDGDVSRRIEIELEVSLTHNERISILSESIISDSGSSLIQSHEHLLAQLRFHFRSLKGNSGTLHLNETHSTGSDGQFFLVHRMNTQDEGVINPQHQVISFEKIYSLNNGFPSKQYGNEFFQSPLNINFTLDNERLLWPHKLVAPFIRSMFFLEPFRHSSERLTVQEAPALTQDGANLCQLLHTLLTGNRKVFSRIEDFMNAAMPNIGMLQTPLRAAQTEIGFLSNEGDLYTRLRNMGGGIEQLLMVATVLHTTKASAPIFLEEPESFLHAGAQRFLAEQLNESGRQVFISTHSPVFVNSLHTHRLYQVSQHNRRTSVRGVGNEQELTSVLADIGVRNSDVLLSDAVAFVEGPSDVAIFERWCLAMGKSLASKNIALLSMGGGEMAERTAPIRSSVIMGISAKAPFPHLFVLDRDEREEESIDRISGQLKDKIVFLNSREIENYLLNPRAVRKALDAKHAHDATIRKKVSETTDEEIENRIDIAATKLKGIVLVKRIRARLKPLTGGALSRDLMNELALVSNNADFEQVVVSKIKRRLDEYVSSLDVDRILAEEKERISTDWSTRSKRLQMAPGEEILTDVFQSFGSTYNKMADGVRIAAAMEPDEIPAEILTILGRMMSLKN